MPLITARGLGQGEEQPRHAEFSVWQFTDQECLLRELNPGLIDGDSAMRQVSGVDKITRQTQELFCRGIHE